jgi:hypothetical protein
MREEKEVKLYIFGKYLADVTVVLCVIFQSKFSIYLYPAHATHSAHFILPDSVNLTVLGESLCHFLHYLFLQLS